MKKIIIFSLVFFCAISANASEITGGISTDPDKLNKPAQNGSTTPPDNNIPKNTKANGGAVPFYFLAQMNQPTTKKSDDIKVLGIAHYPDNSLLRNTEKQVFVAAGRFKKRVTSLKELQKYKGQKIYDVSNDTLSQYGIIEANWLLIKEKGKANVYVIKNGKKIWIPNMTELSRYFSGDKIMELSEKEMKLF